VLLLDPSPIWIHPELRISRWYPASSSANPSSTREFRSILSNLSLKLASTSIGLLFRSKSNSKCRIYIVELPEWSENQLRDSQSDKWVKVHIDYVYSWIIMISGDCLYRVFWFAFCSNYLVYLISLAFYVNLSKTFSTLSPFFGFFFHYANLLNPFFPISQPLFFIFLKWTSSKWHL